MYAALMTGIANYLCKHFKYEPSQVKYGGTDDFWNKFNLEKVKSPGLIYGSSQISFPRGMSAHGATYMGNTNISETAGTRVKPILFSVMLTLGMIADNENDHFYQIHKYVELGAFNAKLVYKVQLPDFDTTEDWESTVNDFSELTPAPGGRDSNHYDVEGRIYKLEGTFTVNSQFFVTDRQKLIRCIYVGGKELGEDGVIEGLVGYDSNGNKAPRMRGLSKRG